MTNSIPGFPAIAIHNIHEILLDHVVIHVLLQLHVDVAKYSNNYPPSKERENAGQSLFKYAATAPLVV